jgi:energy-coupling factor transporter ATP-binding protein EcfA2
MDTDDRGEAFITRVTVEGLFGQYAYDLDTASHQGTDFSKLIIIYGDNGSGKTTLLRAIFHLLSPSLDKGHRKLLGEIPFQRLAVQLGSATVIIAEREDGCPVGDFTMRIEQNGEARETARFEFGPDKKLLKGKSRGPLLDMLGSLDIKLHFLSDDRKILTDMVANEDEDEDRHLLGTRHLLSSSRLFYGSGVSRTVSESKSPLLKTLDAAREWIRSQAISGSGAGEVSTNALYTNITKQIVDSPSLRKLDDTRGLSDLTREFTEQADRSVPFSKLGLTTELNFDDLLASLKSPRAMNKAVLLNQILRPFIDGIKVRLDALQPLQATVSGFLNRINSFLSGKALAFNLSEGFKITTSTGQALDPKLLSSGEKQLLLLFCNVLSASEHSSIFIIDEPELSLNIKWQRQLVTALLECSGSSQTQFVFATHSIELLSQHSDNVLRLTEPTRV